MTESQIHVLGKLTRDLIEHSVTVESALFRIQALPAEQTLELIQASILLYSDPETLEKAVQRVSVSRADLEESLESVKIAIHGQRVSEALQETAESAERFNEAIEKAILLLKNGQKPEAMDVLMNRCTQLETALVGNVAKLQNACTAEQSNKRDETRLLDAQRIASERRTLLWLVLGGLGAGLGFILSIRRPLHPHTD
ncbi:MAG: hypothetical protein WCL08_03110 [Verrucomicrobiota bacterium]